MLYLVLLSLIAVNSDPALCAFTLAPSLILPPVIGSTCIPLWALNALYMDRKGGFCGILTPPLDWELRKGTSWSPWAVTDSSISSAGARGTVVPGRSHKCVSKSLIPNCQSLFQQPANTLSLVWFLHFSFLALTLLSLLLFLLCLQTTKQVKGRWECLVASLTGSTF